MAKSYKLLRDKMRPEAKKLANEKTYQMLAEINLQELRKLRNISQEEMAKILKLRQPAISKMERRSDMHISSLRRIVEGMGGDLSIIAKFPDADIPLCILEDDEDYKTNKENYTKK